MDIDCSHDFAHVAARIDRNREELVATILAHARPATNVHVGHELFADVLIERVIAGFESGSFECVATAVRERLTNEYAADGYRAVAVAVVPALREVLRALRAFSPPDAALRTIAGRIEDALAHCDRERHRESPAQDEIDVAIEELLGRLVDGDPLTAIHSRAVSAWCRRIATRLGFDPAETQFVVRCGLLHDIGKVAVPLDILIAPRRLSPVEYELMKTHTVAGWRMISDHPLLRPLAAAVRSHHERFDGNGYPDGLAFDQTDLATRIVTVADAFNALVGRRPYRTPMNPLHALEELDRHRGTQFDPEIVQALIDVMAAPPAEMGTLST